MTIAGIIAEYNPFHEGHRYHIEETKRLTGADYVIVVMSGDFVQRGEPAILDKYQRAGMALQGGADLVLELPAYYATSSAEYFATAGVTLLDQLGCVDYLSCGSEWACLPELEAIARILVEEPAEYKEILKACLEQGKNYPQARETAVRVCCPDQDYGRILQDPNHILAVEYLKALLRRKSRMKALVIPRKGSGYLQESYDAAVDIYPSATAIRTLLRAGDAMAAFDEKIASDNKASSGDKAVFDRRRCDDIESYDLLKRGCPYAADLLWEAMATGDTVSWQDLMPYLDCKVLMKHKVLGKYYGMDYELARRVTRIYRPGRTFAEIIAQCHSRNYTDAALRRAFLHLVLDMADHPFLRDASRIPVPYARVLGFRRESGKLLRLIREQGEILLIQKTVEGKVFEKHHPVEHTLYDTDLLCADFYEQIAAAKAGREARIEFVRGPVIL